MKLSTTDPYIFLLVMSISFRDFFYLIYGEVRKKYTLEFKKIQMSKSTVAKKKKKKTAVVGVRILNLRTV